MQDKLLPLIALCATACASAATFYVAPQGNDGNPGTREAPLATIDKAQQMVREARARQPLHPVEVVFLPGRFALKQRVVFTTADSGTPAAPVVWRAEQPRQTRFSGAADIPAKAFKPVSEETAAWTRLDKEASAHILMADLKTLNLGELPPFKLGGTTLMPELFFNDQRMQLARWPDSGWENIARIIDGGTKTNTGNVQANPQNEVHEQPRGGIFEYSGDRPSRWDVSKGVYLRGYWCFDWSEEVIQAANIDVDKKQIGLAKQHHYGLRQGNPSPRRWYAVNLLEELTAPGEFYLDYVHGQLYFYPPTDLASATIRLTVFRDTLFTVNKASNLTFRGLLLEEAMSGISVNDSDNIRIEACEVRNMHGNGISVTNGKDCTIHSCDVHDLGTGGVAVRGGDRRNLVPQHHLVENCHIWNFAYHKLTYSHGLEFGGIGNVARHNELHDAPHMAIALSSNDNIFEYNLIHHVCLAADDSGALYKGRNPALRGNIVRYNFWHTIGKPMGHGVAAIYFDDGDVGETVYGNLFFRCGDPGRGSFGTVFCHGGHGHLAENNVFIECKRPLGSAPWGDQRWKDMIDGALWQQRLLKDVDITKPPYTTKYPDFVGFMEPKPGQPRVSHARKNLLVMCADIKSGNWQVDDTNLITDEDPGFVDIAHGNFNFKKDAEVFKKMPGFEPLPVDKMGLYACELRPEVQKTPWTLPPPKPLPKLEQAKPAPPRHLMPKVNPPVHKVEILVEAPNIDGDFSEWGFDEKKALPLGVDYSGVAVASQYCGYAMVKRDKDALYVVVVAHIDANAKLDTNSWGRSHAVEIACKPDDKSLPVTVLRGYANGFLYYGIAPHGNADPLNQEPSPCRFAARRLSPTTWCAEFAIPFEKLNLDKNKLPRCAFNVTVRNPDIDKWIMWEATYSNSNNAHQAGRLEWSK